MSERDPLPKPIFFVKADWLGQGDCYLDISAANGGRLFFTKNRTLAWRGEGKDAMAMLYRLIDEERHSMVFNKRLVRLKVR